MLQDHQQIQNTICRRSFLRKLSAASLGAILAGNQTNLFAQTNTVKPKNEMIWASLFHLSYNMWRDWDNPKIREINKRVGKPNHTFYQPYLRFDEKLWNDLLEKMVKFGMNMVVIDLGDAVQYESHPEIAVKNAWPVKKLKAELAKIRKMGLEPIPKLNFATTHDTWLGKYSRCVSTDTYYNVCKDLIAEVSDIFDRPRLFHLGMDEETAKHQQFNEYIVVRQADLWWHDFYFLVDQVTTCGCRPWIWSDYLWHHPEMFFKKMPKVVLQSNWYYRDKFEKDVAEKDIVRVKAYRDLEEHGYDQVPTGSNWTSDENFGMTVDYCKKVIDPQRLKGFMQTPWHPTLESLRQHHINSVDQVGRAIAKF